MSTTHTKDFMTSDEAATWLNVQRQTLYSYVSRGLVRSVQSQTARERLYASEDLERLRQRSIVRDGQAAVAASALNLGHPIVVTSITEITPMGPRYRGRLAVELAAQDACFEQVAELLWSGIWHDEPLVWQPAKRVTGRGIMLDELTRTMAREQIAEVFALAVMQLGMGRGTVQRRLTQGRPMEAARGVIQALTGCLGFYSKAGTYIPPNSSLTVVSSVFRALGKFPTEADQRLLNATLILLADHELSPGTFAARIAASSGSSLHACLAAALAANVDFLVVITPGGAGTKHLINAEVLQALGPRGFLINVARGSVVDEAALIAALQNGTIAGAGLDVFANEPNVPEALWSMRNVVLTPHMASATTETRQAMADLAFANMQAGTAGRPLRTPVPECANLNPKG